MLASIGNHLWWEHGIDSHRIARRSANTLNPSTPCAACAAAAVESTQSLARQGWSESQIEQAIERYGPALCPAHQRDADLRRGRTSRPK